MPADPLPLAWDAWDEGVAEGVMPYDNVQRTHVSPRDKTPGLVYDPETDSYVLPGTQIAKRPDETHPAVSTVKPASAMPAATPSGQDWTGFAGSGTWDDAGYDPDFIDYGDEEPTIWEGSTRTRYERVGGTTVQDLPGSVQMDIVRYGRVGTAIEEVPETKPKVVPDIVPEAQNAHVHEEAPDDGEQPPLPVYMQEQHRDLHFQHSSAPMHLPPPHT